MLQVTVYGQKKGFRSASVIVMPDGTMYRGDVDLALAIRLKNLTEAAKVVGMTRDEFIKARDEAREAK